MEKSASRRRFLQDMTALGAAGGVSAALGATSASASNPSPSPRLNPFCLPLKSRAVCRAFS
jgi:hypothetical protein